MNKTLFLLLLVSSPLRADQPRPCRNIRGYALRYTTEDKANPANNVLWLEDNKGFRLASVRGAECQEIVVAGERMFWIEYPSHQMMSLNLQTRTQDSYSEAFQFSISPDAERMVLEKVDALSCVNLRTKNEVDFFTFPKNDVLPGRNRVLLLGWPPDVRNFWFVLLGPERRPLDLRALTRTGDLIRTNHRTDALEEAVFRLDKGWITQNNGTSLSVFDLLAEKKTVITTFPVGTRVRPRWANGGHLQYEKEGKTETLLTDDVARRMAASATTTPTIEKREFVPVSW